MRISDWSSDVCSSDLDATTCGGNIRIASQINPGNKMASSTKPSTGIKSGIKSIGLNAYSNVATQRIFASRSEEHTSELQSLMRISYAVFCLKTKTNYNYQSVSTSCTHTSNLIH